ncbi:MAG TPA: D-alanyl-D-alanine carboxypeptidase/D-alanyl-D-alanine-endopeptidase [Longimicrobiales bacterium]|nr:D-alanyl-D-alanine carboxypeptidase/D-alanyl-D-alanine-endopeptidase [Longimicrobiales bacterium]
MTSRIRTSVGALVVALLLGASLTLPPAPARAQSQAGSAAPGGAVAHATDLAARISTIVDRPPLDRAHWGIFVQDAHSGEVLYQRNADRLFIPASNLKLVVASAAAHLLPSDFRLRTSLYATGPIRDGVLDGDLVLYGRGDPGISGRFHDGRMLAVWEALADSLAARGVREVRGGLVADQSHLDSLHVHEDWESYDLLWWYAAPVGALGFNDNSIDFRIQPGERGEPARIEAQPASSYFTLLNQTRTVAAGEPRTLDFARASENDTIIAYGNIPVDARPWTEYFAVSDPALYAGTVFRDVLESRGIRFGSPVVRVERSEHRSVVLPDGSTRAGARSLFGYSSAPLADLIFPVLNSSQNWFAEQLLKTLGRQRGEGGSWHAGLDVERDFLTGIVGLSEDEFRLRDASGLSAGNLMTPRALARVLLWVRTEPAVQEALPVSAGAHGSLRSRLTDLPGRVRAKTGGIRNVDALSGYVTTNDGRELVFVILANGSAFTGSVVRGAIDDVVRAAAAAEGP